MHPPTVGFLGRQTLDSSSNHSSSSSFPFFEIRLERDSISFRGSQYESTDQLLTGVLVLCLQSPLRVEEVQLRLDGTVRHSWTLDPGVAHENTILKYKWSPFVGAPNKSTILPSGNYEWPFECLIPGNTPETVEGVSEASIIYRLKATISRGKLARHIYARKQFRVIRTLLLTSQEFMHSMSIENTWVDKVDYSVAIPTKAVVFGGCVKLEMRFTPLIKGLKLGRITVTLIEHCRLSIQSRHSIYRKERQTRHAVCSWELDIARGQDWQDSIEGTEQQGWVLVKPLDLPKRLGQYSQDLDVQGISVSHKMRIMIPLQNPDGHTSQLDMALPLHVFMQPNMQFDEQGNLAESSPHSLDVIPPEYGEHVLDQLYEENYEEQGIWRHSESGIPSSISTSPSIPPILDHAEQGRTPDLPVQLPNGTDSPLHSSPEASSPSSSDIIDLTRVPTYRTAVRTPFRSYAQPGNIALPSYERAAGYYD
ncbi:hypothetical protein FZEAL_10478 [Fusarium zealandicum]|uniref:Arrestin C-terminal-like domain-containing protein n=1 Tax=Fusarium zealandicum TaxID=1053134 RepID=A0A8H4U119_9HYPO|nr:hypothetical protein FZEAL_10478 [Fusarium zealandicum]